METNNKLREALTRVKKIAASYINCHDDEIDRVMTEIVATCDSALAEPVKNNEVGTAEKQAARHHAWCRRHGINGDNKVDCAHPDMSCDLCTLRWAQTPYEEKKGVTK